MKKIFFVFAVLLFSFSFAREQMPLIPEYTPTTIEIEEDNCSDLINTKGMKKSSKVEKAKAEAAKYQNRTIKLDSKQIIHERALNYTTRYNNTMMPPAF